MHNSSFCINEKHPFCDFLYISALRIITKKKHQLRGCARAQRRPRDFATMENQGEILRGKLSGLGGFPMDFPMNRLDSSKGKDPLELDADFSPKIHRFPEDHLTLGYFGHFSAKTRNTNRTATARPQKKSTNLENLGSATHLECSKYTKVYVTLRKYRQQ